MEAPKAEISKKQAGSHRRVLVACIALVAAMGGLAYASVPLYQLFCQVTGYGGTTQRAEAGSASISDELVTVRFDANIAQGLDWKFYPAQRSVTVRFGETVQIAYFAENMGGELRTGSATFNVTPQQAGAYFNKIECFCFTETVVKPGEKLEMPVIFFVDPELKNTEEGKGVNTITLSYTFFGVDGEGGPVAVKTETTKSGSTGG
jgi:cytochrome c oxidase assembly protein subunit 11